MKLALFTTLLIVACSRGASRTNSTPSGPESPAITSPTPNNDSVPMLGSDEVCAEDWTFAECDHAIMMRIHDNETTGEVDEVVDRANPLDRRTN